MDEQWNLVEEIKKLSVGERAALRREAGGKPVRCQRPRFGGVLSPNSSGAQQQKAGVLVLRADPRLPVECGGSQGERQHAQAASAIGHASGYRRHGCANTFPAGYPVGGRRVSVRQAV